MAEDYVPLKRTGAIVPAGTDDTILAQGIEATAGEVTFTDLTSGTVLLSSLVAGASSTYLGLTDTFGSFAGLEGRSPRTNLAENALISSTCDINAMEMGASGVFSGGVLSVLNGTTIRVSAGSGMFALRQTGGTSIGYREVEWNQTDIVLTGLANSGSWIVVQDGGVPLATVVEKTTEPTGDRTIFLLGLTLHEGGVLIEGLSVPEVARDIALLVRDATDNDSVQLRRGSRVDEIPASLTFDSTNVSFFGEGINFHIDPDDPNKLAILDDPLVSFNSIAGDGTVFNSAITVVPATWNNGGSETGLTGNRAAVHQIIVGVDGRFWVQLGTTNYQNFDTAVENIFNEALTNPIWAQARFFGSLIAYAVISNGATVWADSSARIFHAGSESSSVGTSDATEVPSLSFAHSNSISLTASPKSPLWDIDFHPSVDTTLFTYPSVGSISNNEVQVLKKGMYSLSADGVAFMTAGTYMNPGLSFYKDGVEIQGTQSSTAAAYSTNIQHYSCNVEVELDINELVTPGFYKFSGTQELIGNRTRFSIKLLRETP